MSGIKVQDACLFYYYYLTFFQLFLLANKMFSAMFLYIGSVFFQTFLLDGNLFLFH